METTAVAFLGNYLNSRLKDGMRKDDVHLAINRFQRTYSFRQSVETEQEFFLLDPLETLFIQVGYEKGVYYGPPNVDRVLGYDGLIKAITASCSAVFLLLTMFMKEEKLSRPPMR